MKKAVIIGGGISGLATAALLAQAGHHVTLIEKNAQLGGRARVYKKKGYSFDMGPSWYMMPEVFDRFFALFGKKTSDFYSLIKLNPHYKVVFNPKTHAYIYDDTQKNTEVFEGIEKNAGNTLKTYLARMQKAYDIALQLLYFDTSHIRSWLSAHKIFLAIRFFFLIPFWTNWYAFTQKYFTHPHLLKILTFPAVFLGGSPYNTPALYSLLTWADFGRGIWYPKGGMTMIIRALENLALSHNVTILTSTKVTRVLYLNNAITHVVCGKKKTLACDIVVNTADLQHFETRILDQAHQTYDAAYWKKKTKAISAFIMFIGIKKRLKNATHHTLFFASDWQKNFAALFKKTKKLYTNPSFYVAIASATDRSIVPKAHEQLFVLVPTGAQLSTSAEQYKKYSDHILDLLEDHYGPIRDAIDVVRIYTPHSFAQDYNAYTGTALGLAHTFLQSLFFVLH
ncbi:MAG: zeta-carotene-forming phytoene desaturase [Microgenomates bacterium OLB23]|nr:MAG: zeta-carotene-forming phytoene desaturase [Microgenomates bacterium OLB23]